MSVKVELEPIGGKQVTIADCEPGEVVTMQNGMVALVYTTGISNFGLCLSGDSGAFYSKCLHDATVIARHGKLKVTVAE